MNDSDEDYVEEANAVLSLAQQALSDNKTTRARKHVGCALRLAPTDEVKEEAEVILTKIRWVETAADKLTEASNCLDNAQYTDAIRLARESMNTYTTPAARELMERAQLALDTNTPGRLESENIYGTANRDDALYALSIAKKRLAVGQTSDAQRLAKKSIQLCRTDEAEVFLASIADRDENQPTPVGRDQHDTSSSTGDTDSGEESNQPLKGKAVKTRKAFWENLQASQTASPFQSTSYTKPKVTANIVDPSTTSPSTRTPAPAPAPSRAPAYPAKPSTTASDPVILTVEKEGLKKSESNGSAKAPPPIAPKPKKPPTLPKRPAKPPSHILTPAKPGKPPITIKPKCPPKPVSESDHESYTCNAAPTPTMSTAPTGKTPYTRREEKETCAPTYTDSKSISASSNADTKLNTGSESANANDGVDVDLAESAQDIPRHEDTWSADVAGRGEKMESDNAGIDKQGTYDDKVSTPYVEHIPDVANLDAARLAILKARQALAGGDREKASRLALKSQRLYRSDVAEAFLNALGLNVKTAETQAPEVRKKDEPVAGTAAWDDADECVNSEMDGAFGTSDRLWSASQGVEQTRAWDRYGEQNSQEFTSDKWWETPDLPNVSIPTPKSKSTIDNSENVNSSSPAPPHTAPTTAHAFVPIPPPASESKVPDKSTPDDKPVHTPHSSGSEKQKSKPLLSSSDEGLGEDDKKEAGSEYSAANRDDAITALAAARRAEASGDISKAQRMAKKSVNLFWTAEAESLELRLQFMEPSSKPSKSPGTPPPKPASNGFLNAHESATRAKSAPSSPAPSRAPIHDQVVIQRINDSSTHYDVLAILRNCSQADIHKSYKRLARQLHPDKTKTAGAEEAFKKVLASFDALKDPEKRQAYDVQLLAALQQQQQYSQYQGSNYGPGNCGPAYNGNPYQQQQYNSQQRHFQNNYNHQEQGQQQKHWQQSQSPPNQSTRSDPAWSTTSPATEFGPKYSQQSQSERASSHPLYLKLGLSETIHAITTDKLIMNAKIEGMVWINLTADTVRDVLSLLNASSSKSLVMELHLLGPYRFSCRNPNKAVLQSANQPFPSKLQLHLPVAQLLPVLDAKAVSNGTSIPVLQYDVVTNHQNEKDLRSLCPVVGSAEWRDYDLTITIVHSELSNAKDMLLAAMQVGVVVPAASVIKGCDLSPPGEWHAVGQQIKWNIDQLSPVQPVILRAKFNVSNVGRVTPAPVHIRLKGRGCNMSGATGRVDPFMTGVWIDNTSLLFETGEYTINPTII